MNRLTTTITLLILLQLGCTAYQKTPVSLENAVNRGKVKYDNGIKDEFFRKIVENNGIYYGVREGINYKIPDQNAEVYLRNPSKSVLKTIAAIFVPPLAFFGVIFAILFFAAGGD